MSFLKMVEVELYKPDVFYASVFFPENWNELTPAEVRLIAEAIHKSNTRQEILISLLQERLVMQKITVPANWQAMLNLDQAVTEGLPLIDNLLQNNNLTVNPIPIIHGKDYSFFGPANAFTDIIVGEFEEADAYFNAYFADKKKEHLLSLSRLLWRRPQTPLFTSKRLDYCDIEDDGTSFALTLDDVSLQMIYLWYAGCRHELVKVFHTVFEGGEPSKDNVPGITKLIHAGAGPKNGTREQIRKHTPLLEFLYECQLQIEEAKQLQNHN